MNAIVRIHDGRSESDSIAMYVLPDHTLATASFVLSPSQSFPENITVLSSTSQLLLRFIFNEEDTVGNHEANGPVFSYTSLTACPAGYHRTIETNACEACLPGSFKSFLDESRCVLCPAGTFSSTAASIECSTCLAQTYQPDTGKTECISCQGGKVVTQESTVCDCEEGDVFDTELGRCRGKTQCNLHIVAILKRMEK